MNNDPIRQIVQDALTEWERLALNHDDFERCSDEGLLTDEQAAEHLGNFDYDEMKAAIIDGATALIHSTFERGIREGGA